MYLLLKFENKTKLIDCIDKETGTMLVPGGFTHMTIDSIHETYASAETKSKELNSPYVKIVNIGYLYRDHIEISLRELEGGE